MTVTNEDLAEQLSQQRSAIGKIDVRVETGFRAVQSTLDDHARRFLHLEDRETKRREADLIEVGRRQEAAAHKDQMFAFTWKQAGLVLTIVGVAVAAYSALSPLVFGR